MRTSLSKALLAALLLSAASLAATAQSVPGLKRDLDFDAHMKTVDLDHPSIRVEYKKPSADSSSIGLLIATGNAKTDRSFVPTNASSIPEAEVVSYRLARFLGVARIYYPVDYYKLGPKATAKFRDMVVRTPESEDDRNKNRQMVLKELKENPSSILGIYRFKPKTKMYTVTDLGSEGNYRLNVALAREIQAAGPMPDQRKISLSGIKGGRPGYPVTPTEQRVELARQLSTIFVVDQLLGQWDRFWNNLEASGDKNGRLKLVARDNGGATLDDWEGYETYSRWVSRFDRDLIDRLTALNAFIKGEAKSFMGFTSVERWKEAAGFIVPASFEMFTKKLTLFVEKRVPALRQQFGDRVFFPAKAPEIARLDEADNAVDD